MARRAKTTLPEFDKTPDPIRLVQRFLATEISPKFELIEMLDHAIGVHHSGLSDETRSLIEWLAEDGDHRDDNSAGNQLSGVINFPINHELAIRRFGI